MKKTNLFYLITFLLTSLAYVACNRNTSLEPKVMLSERNRVSLQEAKTFFQANLKGSSKRTVNNLTKYPRWQEAYDGMTQNNLAKISIPLSFEDKQASYRLDKTERKNGKRKSDIVKLNLVVYRDENNDLQAFVLKKLATEEYLRANGYKIKDENFTGIKIAEDWEGNFIKGYTYENGVRTGKITKDYAPNQRGGGRDGSNCTYTVLDVYYRDCYDGDCSGWTYAGSDILGVSCVGLSGGDSELEETPDGGAGGVPAGDEEPDDGTDDITLFIQDTCLRKRVSELVNSNSAVGDSLKKYFGRGKKQLQIEQGDDLPATTAAEVDLGNTLNGAYPTASFQINGMTMSLNNVPLLNASQEYIAETFIHEFFHLSMFMNNTIPPKNDGGQMQHTIMLTDPKYMQQSVAMLQQLYPSLPASHAQAMFLQGFGGYINPDNPNYTANRARWEQALNNTGLTEDFINSRAEWYRTGLFGTDKCNNQ